MLNVEAIAIIQNALNTKPDESTMDLRMMDAFSGCSYGLDIDDKGIVYACNVNVPHPNGDTYDINWTAGSPDVRITRVDP